MVPILYHVLATLRLDESVRMHVAVGTSLAASVPAALASADRSIPRDWIAVLIGVALGSCLLAFASGKTLALLFGVAAVLVVLAVALGRGRPIATVSTPRFVGRLASPVTEGFVAASTGIGGRTVSLPASLLRGSPQPRSTDSASALGAFVFCWRGIGRLARRCAAAGFAGLRQSPRVRVDRAHSAVDGACGKRACALDRPEAAAFRLRSPRRFHDGAHALGCAGLSNANWQASIPETASLGRTVNTIYARPY